MIEIVIERWTNAEGETDFRWSIWSDGNRIQIGQSPHSTTENCEAQALEFCWPKLGRKSDRTTTQINSRAGHPPHSGRQCLMRWLSLVAALALVSPAAADPLEGISR